MKVLISFVILLLFVFTNSGPCDPSAYPINDFNDCKGLEVSADKELCCFVTMENSQGKRVFCDSYSKAEYEEKEKLIQEEEDLKDIICEASTEEGSSENSENSERKKNSNSSKLISLSQTIFILFFLIL